MDEGHEGIPPLTRALNKCEVQNCPILIEFLGYSAADFHLMPDRVALCAVCMQVQSPVLFPVRKDDGGVCVC